MNDRQVVNRTFPNSFIRGCFGSQPSQLISKNGYEYIGLGASPQAKNETDYSEDGNGERPGGVLPQQD
ncbi:hypothetical protein DPMN_133844 [Dreissena polymorpha]|uniref:Uncharacterized protein n=1 Tax=Dreissena polymorpha TaxID=45954 RepID=A0A9D4FV25_DREPO|nr:hypothetical protein DPMN_133844 [Dreissena polymorpha]